jgi:hypothetical protein
MKRLIFQSLKFISSLIFLYSIVFNENSYSSLHLFILSLFQPISWILLFSTFPFYPKKILAVNRLGTNLVLFICFTTSASIDDSFHSFDLLSLIQYYVCFFFRSLKNNFWFKVLMILISLKSWSYSNRNLQRWKYSKKAYDCNELFGVNLFQNNWVMMVLIENKNWNSEYFKELIMNMLPLKEIFNYSLKLKNRNLEPKESLEAPNLNKTIINTDFFEGVIK